MQLRKLLKLKKLWRSETLRKTRTWKRGGGEKVEGRAAKGPKYRTLGKHDTLEMQQWEIYIGSFYSNVGARGCCEGRIGSYRGCFKVHQRVHDGETAF
jgi:hypothetical protein